MTTQPTAASTEVEVGKNGCYVVTNWDFLGKFGFVETPEGKAFVHGNVLTPKPTIRDSLEGAKLYDVLLARTPRGLTVAKAKVAQQEETFINLEELEEFQEGNKVLIGFSRYTTPEQLQLFLAVCEAPNGSLFELDTYYRRVVQQAANSDGYWVNTWRKVYTIITNWTEDDIKWFFSILGDAITEFKKVNY